MKRESLKYDSMSSVIENKVQHAFDKMQATSLSDEKKQAENSSKSNNQDQTKLQNLHTDNNEQKIDAKQRKKLKKKDYRKRKQMKVEKQKQLALLFLEQIVQNIYALKTDYKKQEQTIRKIIQLQTDWETFWEVMDETIRQQQDAIKQYLDQILKQSNPSSINYAIIPKLYELFQTIVYASCETSKIIAAFINRHQTKLYTKKKRNQLDQTLKQLYQNLEERTFRYILAYDEDSNRRLVALCTAVIDSHDNQYEKERFIVEKMIEMIRDMNLSDCQQGDEQTEFSSADDYSTYSSDQLANYQQDLQVVKPAKKNKKKNKKKQRKQQDLESNYEIIMSTLDSLNVDSQPREVCYVSPQWLEKLQNQLSTARFINYFQSE